MHACAHARAVRVHAEQKLKSLNMNEKTEDMNDKTEECVQNSTSGGPSEERSRIRKGQIDWIVGLDKAAEFKSWSFKFKMGAATYLSKDVYQNDDERRFAWVNALIRASSLGKFQELCDQVELLDASGFKCEKLLEKLEKRYLPAIDVEKKRISSMFLSFNRNRSSLLDSYKSLQQILLECRKYGFVPGEETEQAKLEELILPEELPIFRLYIERERTNNEDDSELELIRSAIEALGKDQEDKRKGSNQSTPIFAGTTQRGVRSDRSEKVPRRKGHPERSGVEAGKLKQGNCGRCGKNCPAARGEPKEKGYAFDKECRKCGKKNHFESVCKSGKTAAFSKGAEDKQHDEDTRRIAALALTAQAKPNFLVVD